MGLPRGMILPDGTLDERLIARREPLYTGMNGSRVERLRLTVGGSFIFKPLTNDGQWGSELWVYEHILPYFPPLYPRLLASSIDSRQGRHWLLFEDLGSLDHTFREETAAQLIQHMAWWHGFPTGALRNGPLKGPKPPIGVLAAEISANEEEILRICEEIGAGLPRVQEMLEMLGREESPFEQAKVLSHGDLHAGNYAVAGGRLLVLDWEHMHLNSPFWDLYHALDMSHPTFPGMMNEPVRERLLDSYLAAAGECGMRHDAEPFKRAYALYAAVFSLWMLRLIDGDIRRGSGLWPMSALLRQRQETAASLLQCLERMTG
ncbi:phosphotransferase family protein [Paenibacillus spongiae]|uniref:Aminoglycoside phosphotransferase family protein n=1 Tax=Paenibacillus spongiae TaxID=2909671 RepID=A0ABY5S908_9BACL|nr:aminoglycoside phosphotransferase family protein [Paenibacillus spongiae]UVI30065.1 aminoglycoside phosphotransferase family protein [Paenibacillus spongiae]